jgi:hypothetical protein
LFVNEALIFIFIGMVHTFWMENAQYKQVGGGMGSGAGEGLTLESLHLGRQQLQVRKEGGKEGGGEGGREGLD